MREILFRGKRMDDGEWVEGSFVQCGEAHRFVSRPDLPFSDCYIFGKTDEDIVDSFGEETVFFNIGAYHIDPETVGQYTGLTDKNGTKIFEGDIVRHHNGFPDSEIEEKGAVFWDEKYCGWRRTSNGAFHHGVADTYRISPECCYEIIGNIRDNPELLQGGE